MGRLIETTRPSISLNELFPADEQVVALFQLTATGAQLAASSPNTQWLRVGARALLADLSNDESDAPAPRGQQQSTSALDSGRMPTKAAFILRASNKNSPMFS